MNYVSWDNINKSLPENFKSLCLDFGKGLCRILQEKLRGAYIYGACVFPDSLPTRDIDFHVIFDETLTNQEKTELYNLHDFLGQQYPPLGGEFDGYYILSDDARHSSAPQSEMWQLAVDDSWPLHKQHILSGMCIKICGEDPDKLFSFPSWDEIRKSLHSEFSYIEEHLDEYPDFSILNMCRILYTLEYSNPVISKAGSAKWALNKFPQWSHIIESALRSYAEKADSGDREIMEKSVKNLYDYVKTALL